MNPEIIKTKKYKFHCNKTSFLLFLKSGSTRCKARHIWKRQKDYRLSAAVYLNTLSEKNFNNDEEIKQKLLKNKKHYFNKLEKHTLELNKQAMYSNSSKDTLTSNNGGSLVNQGGKQKTEELIYQYYLANYYIQYKPYLINQMIDQAIIEIRNKKISRYLNKMKRLDQLIEKLNQKLKELVAPTPKTKMNNNNEIIEIIKAPVDLNKPNKKTLNIMNSISVYEARKQKYTNQILNIEHHFDLIHQQWQRNEFHKLITNPYYKTK